MKQLFMWHSRPKGRSRKNDPYRVIVLLPLCQRKNVAVIGYVIRNTPSPRCASVILRWCPDSRFYKGMKHEQVTRLGGRNFTPSLESNPQGVT